MTREERELAIEELQGCIIAEEHGKNGKPNGNVTCELTKDTIDLAIKVLEQEPILDKIRAEIMALRNIRAEEFDIDSDVFDDRVILRSDVLKILDKYKAESEEKK